MAVAEMGLGLNMLPIARNYPLLSVDVVQQNGGDKLYDKATPRDQQQGGQQKTQQQQQQQQMQAQVPQANGGGVVVRESSKALDYEAAEGLDGGSSIVSNDSMRELEELLTKLNPLAKEFVPPSHSNARIACVRAGAGASLVDVNSKNGNNGGSRKRGSNSRTNRAQREDSIRRTVYVSDIDQQVTEEQLAALFITCGQVVDCRVCGDPNSVLRFAFVEFTDEEGARAALSLGGTMLGYYPVRVLPSKTAIVPVNPTFLPRTEDDRETCARTVYCTNIDKKVSQADVKLFFESLCGEVARLRLLGDYHHSTRIAFVEFVMAESAMAALNCSGAILGSLPIRVSPSKTPVRPRSPRPPLH
ncbi:unnamed protein product [Sphagnum jensenii]|uniref:RRM domain-containing protein n=1 Tax=Sphagnum jensenii TaxID=128206 RepID=A0ABP1C336_9BRYO